jgi:hypothetical protein
MEEAQDFANRLQKNMAALKFSGLIEPKRM